MVIVDWLVGSCLCLVYLNGSVASGVNTIWHSHFYTCTFFILDIEILYTIPPNMTLTFRKYTRTEMHSLLWLRQVFLPVMQGKSSVRGNFHMFWLKRVYEILLLIQNYTWMSSCDWKKIKWWLILGAIVFFALTVFFFALNLHWKEIQMNWNLNGHLGVIHLRENVLFM